MSEQEKYEAQGRAHAKLRQHDSNVATLTTSLREYAKSLIEVGREIDLFALDPSQRSPGAMKPQAENLKDQLRKLETTTDRAIFQLGELHEEASNARLLRDQIVKF